MSKSQSKPDPTIRGGLINVPDPTEHPRPIRHQPDTPRTKKQTTTRPDFKPTASPEPTQPEKPQPSAAPMGESPPDEPAADPTD